MEAQRFVWEGAIPLQIHLHESEVTTLPPPAPALILAPRVGYLPLLAPLIKPHFASALPPGVDTVWFEYKGLPLKWYIPTGVLFDLLCAEPKRPWNLTADYIINGNCKNVMHMSQSDQVELWHSILNGNLEAYLRASSKLKLCAIEDEFSIDVSLKSRRTLGEADMGGNMRTGKIPVRLYVWIVSEDFEDFEDAPEIDSWDKIAYINRPLEIHKEEGKYFTLYDALKSLLPEYFADNPLITEHWGEVQDEPKNFSEDVSSDRTDSEREASSQPEELCGRSSCAEIKLVRIQGIEPKLEIPFSWVVNNLKNPENFLHICVVVKFPHVNAA